MKVPALFSAGWIGRLITTEARGLRRELQRTNDLLERLVNHLVPIAPLVLTPEDLAHHTSADHVDANDQVLAQHFVELVERTEGRSPTDDEIMTYLADEKTRDLHTRLLARDRELAARYERKVGRQI